MIILQNKLLVLFCTVLIFSHTAFSQDTASDELQFNVYRVYPFISINKENLADIITISDFRNETNDRNLNYDRQWVKEFISVEIQAIIKGKLVRALSPIDSLSKEQKDLINWADAGKEIIVRVKYIPLNTLTYDEHKELSFKIMINPEINAKFPGGHLQLLKYLEEKVMNYIPENTFQDYDLSVIKFIIDEEGKVNYAHVFGSEYQTSKNDSTDQLLLQTIRNMPIWDPAEYADGTRVQQEFVFTVGNMENCMKNFFYINTD